MRSSATTRKRPSSSDVSDRHCRRPLTLLCKSITTGPAPLALYPALRGDMMYGSFLLPISRRSQPAGRGLQSRSAALACPGLTDTFASRNIQRRERIVGCTNVAVDVTRFTGHVGVRRRSNWCVRLSEWRKPPAPSLGAVGLAVVPSDRDPC